MPEGSALAPDPLQCNRGRGLTTAVGSQELPTFPNTKHVSPFSHTSSGRPLEDGTNTMKQGGSFPEQEPHLQINENKGKKTQTTLLVCLVAGNGSPKTTPNLICRGGGGLQESQSDHVQGENTDPGTDRGRRGRGHATRPSAGPESSVTAGMCGLRDRVGRWPLTLTLSAGMEDVLY